MIKLALACIAGAAAAGAFGFTRDAGPYTSLALIAFYIFLGLFLILAMAGLLSAHARSASGGAAAGLVMALLAGAGFYLLLGRHAPHLSQGQVVDHGGHEREDRAL